MDNPNRVSFCERIRYLRRNVDSFSQLEGLSLNASCESFALDILHHYEAARVFFRDFVDRADVGVIELCSRSCFTDETALRSIIGV